MIAAAKCRKGQKDNYRQLYMNYKAFNTPSIGTNGFVCYTVTLLCSLDILWLCFTSLLFELQQSWVKSVL